MRFRGVLILVKRSSLNILIGGMRIYATYIYGFFTIISQLATSTSTSSQANRGFRGIMICFAVFGYFGRFTCVSGAASGDDASYDVASLSFDFCGAHLGK